MTILDELANNILKGNKRSIAKAISIIENNSFRDKHDLLNTLYPYTGKARVIGITGPPGAGKSTLVDGLIEQVRSEGLKIGIIAVDPSSPYTGGAILGDRIRMQRHATDPEVFIRSMGSRGMLGGLAKATREAINVLDASGIDVIIIETVGVGQSELEIINIADTTVVVLHPSTGDSIQAFKAGIMEIADLFVVNKSDLPGSQKMVYEIELLIETTKNKKEWVPSIVQTIGSERIGIEDLWKNIKNHDNFMEKSGLMENKKRDNIKMEVSLNLQELFEQKLLKMTNTKEFNEIVEKIRKKEKAPMEVAETFYKKFFNKS